VTLQIEDMMAIEQVIARYAYTFDHGESGSLSTSLAPSRGGA
jgi:hypothetical protein